MRKLFGAFAFTAIAVLSLVGTGTASAATEFGNNCPGNEVTEAPNTYFALSAVGDPLPLAAPSAGVITQWKINSQIPFTFQQTLKVVRPTGPQSVMIVGEAPGTVSGGTSTFSTRIPIQAGDLLGLYGTSQEIEGTTVGTLFCTLPGQGENRIGAFAGAGGGPGFTGEFVLIESEAGFPVSAVIEPDADNDGYGDETQDKCPQNAAVQVACPMVTLSATSVTRKGSASISLTSNIQATVTVKGTARLGKGKSAKLSGGTQIVAPGTLAKFTLLFPGKLKSTLKALSSKQSLTLTVTATAPNIIGPPTKKILKLHLRGQAKPKKGRSHKKS